MNTDYSKIINNEFDKLWVDSILSGIDNDFNNLIINKCAVCGGIILGSKLSQEDYDELPRLTDGRMICEECLEGYSTQEEADEVDKDILPDRYLDEDRTIIATNRKRTWDEAMRCEKKCKKILSEMLEIGSPEVYTKYKQLLEE